MFYPEAAFAASRLSLSSAILSFTPFPRGNDTYGLVAFPIMNTLFNLITEKIQMEKKLQFQAREQICILIEHYARNDMWNNRQLQFLTTSLVQKELLVPTG